jgi:hypothetical protein
MSAVPVPLWFTTQTEKEAPTKIEKFIHLTIPPALYISWLEMNPRLPNDATSRGGAASSSAMWFVGLFFLLFLWARFRGASIQMESFLAATRPQNCGGATEALTACLRLK